MTKRQKHFYEFGPFRLDAETCVIEREGKPVPLTPTPARVLRALVERAGQIVLKEDLVKQVWPDSIVEDGNVHHHISTLRGLLREGFDGNECIENLPRRGYRLSIAVIEHWEQEPEAGRVTEAIPLPLTYGVPKSGMRPDAAGSSDSCPAKVCEPLIGDADGQAHSSIMISEPLPGVESAQQTSGGAVSRRSRRAVLFVLLIGAAVLALTVGVFLSSRPRQSPPQREVQITHDGHNKSGPILTDGSRLYFTEDINGEFRPYQVLVSGGETAPVPTLLHNFFLFDISPNSSELLGMAPYEGETDAQLWATPVLGGSPRRLGSLHGRDPSYSPDGRRVAYLSGSGLFIAASDGSKAHQVATLPKFRAFRPRWSPRGDCLRFKIQEQPGDSPPASLWEISTDGTKLRQLFTGSDIHPADGGGTWTADGKCFVFASEQNGIGDLWVVRERLIPIPWMSREPMQLTSGPLDLSSPTPSNDGKRVFAVGEQGTAELSRYDAAHQAFEPYLSGLSVTWVSSTRDHEWIGYITYPEGILWRMRRDGSDKKQLTFSPTKISGYAWSPDGAQIAVYSQEPGEPSRVGLMARDGGKIEYPIPNSGAQGIPSWSPDGNRLAFGDVPAVFGQDDGTHAIRLFDFRTGQLSDLPDSKGLWTARWSPNGRFIAALDITSQNLKLYDCSTQAWRDLRAGPANNVTWTRDSRYIYYDALGSPDPAIYRVLATGGRLERVASLGGLHRAVLWWSGLDGEDSPLIVREIGSAEIYAVELDAR